MVEFTSNSIKGWAEEDRPREKLILKGKGSLSEAELLAIILGSGSVKMSAVDLAKQILNTVGNNLHDLSRLSLIDLQGFSGIGEAKAVAIVAALELAKRKQSTDIPKRKQIQNSQDAYVIFSPIIADLAYEEFWVLLLNKSNKVIDKRNISRGGVDGTVADVKMIFKAAIENLSSSIIICHNHPSGSLNPSNPDIALTKKIKEIGDFMGIKLLDHLIVTENGYYSFSDEGGI